MVLRCYTEGKEQVRCEVSDGEEQGGIITTHDLMRCLGVVGEWRRARSSAAARMLIGCATRAIAQCSLELIIGYHVLLS